MSGNVIPLPSARGNAGPVSPPDRSRHLSPANDRYPPEPFIDEDEGLNAWMAETRRVWGARIGWFCYFTAVGTGMYFAFQLGRGAF